MVIAVQAMGVDNGIKLSSLGAKLNFYWRGYHWPAFNVADTSISVGVVLLALRMLTAPASSSR